MGRTGPGWPPVLVSIAQIDSSSPNLNAPERRAHTSAIHSVRMPPGASPQTCLKFRPGRPRRLNPSGDAFIADDRAPPEFAFSTSEAAEGRQKPCRTRASRPEFYRPPSESKKAQPQRAEPFQNPYSAAGERRGDTNPTALSIQAPPPCSAFLI